MAYRETAQVKARKAAQREALLRTAETLVRDGGFAAMTMQTVADRAGVGVGTLYRYFDNKATLAAAVFAVATQREVDAVDRALAGGGDASARLERALRLFARRALAAPRLAWALIAEPVEPEVDAERLRYRAAYAALYQRVLDQGVAAGELPPQSTALAAAALVGAIAEALAEHHSILKAIRVQDPEAARSAMSIHLGQLMDRIAPLEHQHPTYFRPR